MRVRRPKARGKEAISRHQVYKITAECERGANVSLPLYEAQRAKSSEEREVPMSIEGIFLQPGEAQGVSLRGTQVDFLVTAEHAKGCSVFIFSAAPGFDTGAHYHTKIEEIFYVLEGELTLRVGDRVVQGGPGTFMFVPMGAAHSFGNHGSNPARMLLITAPPGHEHYFEELSALLAQAGPPDPEAIAALRRKYDTVQVEALTSGS
jgi:quercetin dioxygenase-like cupin family protein